MHFTNIVLAIFCLFTVTFANAETDLFKANIGIYRNTPELISNDKALLCVGYDTKDCEQGQFRALAATGSTDGSFIYELEYSIKGQTCKATIGKHFISGKGWATTEFKIGINCN